MSRVKGWHPDGAAQILGGPSFDPDAAAWQRIEATLPLTLDQSDRCALIAIGEGYLGRRWAELEAPTDKEVSAHIEELQNAASVLYSKLQDLKSARAGPYVAKWFEVTLARSRDHVPTNLGRLEEGAEALIGAASRLQADFEREWNILDIDGNPFRLIETKAANYAWEQLITDLAELSDRLGMKVSARGDHDVWGKRSPFVLFVTEVHAAFPEEYQRQTKGTGGLSRPIADALRTMRRRKRVR